MDARETVRTYYDALRMGDVLAPYFAPEHTGDDASVKFGLSERLVAVDQIRAGLAEQTATTTDWVVDSQALRVTERECHAWMSDEVFLAWTDTARGIRFEFDTRWSGTLARRPADDRGAPDGQADPGDGDAPPWRFVGMHVSTATAL